jgi:uncharacterized protein DUF5908
MPVLISEIVFKGEIVGAAPAAQPSAKPQDRRVDQRELIETCVDQVMRLLERREER